MPSKTFQTANPGGCTSCGAGPLKTALPFRVLALSVAGAFFGVLGALVFYLGYYVLFQGPLSIIEYVLFPLMSHFLHLGEMFAHRSRQLWCALWASNPWAEWARQGRDAVEGH